MKKLIFLLVVIICIVGCNTIHDKYQVNKDSSHIIESEIGVASIMVNADTSWYPTIEDIVLITQHEDSVYVRVKGWWYPVAIKKDTIYVYGYKSNPTLASKDTISIGYCR